MFPYREMRERSVRRTRFWSPTRPALYFLRVSHFLSRTLACFYSNVQTLALFLDVIFSSRWILDDLEEHSDLNPQRRGRERNRHIPINRRFRCLRGHVCFQCQQVRYRIRRTQEIHKIAGPKERVFHCTISHDHLQFSTPMPANTLKTAILFSTQYSTCLQNC